jgi:hypothetical protein
MKYVYKVLIGYPEDYLEDTSVVERMILKLVLIKYLEDLGSIREVQDQWRALVFTVMNIRVLLR